MRRFSTSVYSTLRPCCELVSLSGASSYPSGQAVTQLRRSSTVADLSSYHSSFIHKRTSRRGVHSSTQCVPTKQWFSMSRSVNSPPHSGVTTQRVDQSLSESPQVLAEGPGNEAEGPGSGKDHRPPPERMLKLGKTIRILQTRLPTLLVNPLPPEILSPHITLRLFPSTHPHLPVVTGKIAYTAALWTSPVAWGRVPVVGNVRLEILSERMVRNDSSGNSQGGDEKLIVRWKTGRSAATINGGSSMTDMIRKMLNVLGGDADSTPSTAHQDGDFHGMFLFEFDEEGRIVVHTIEHVEQGNVWERTAKVISVTDWLLGKGWRKEQLGGVELAFCGEEQHENGKKK